VTQLRIVVTADPYIPIPPVAYGGIERIVDLVVRGLAARGHRITLVAHADSTAPVELIPYGDPRDHLSRSARLQELRDVAQAVWSRRKDTDVILSWGRLAALAPVLPLRSLAKVQRYARNPVPWRGVKRAALVAGRSLTFAAPSSSVYDDLKTIGSAGGRWITIYDGIDTSRFVLTPTVPSDAPVVFLGKLEPRKGAHRAIEIARIADRPLVIAGTIDTAPGGTQYFEREIEPHIDGVRVQYAGPVDDAAKSELLGQAAALLFPSTWKESFGIVIAEALSCGTPVIAYGGGSVPELIRPGFNGYIVADPLEAAAHVMCAQALDRSAIRADCVARFDAARTVDAFERALFDAVERL
jgi:glycosyltransferase involved in cell wall biosynthesis